MIPRSRPVAVAALCLAVSSHLGALAGRPAKEPVKTAGGGPAAISALGSAFSDMVAGQPSPVAPETMRPEMPDQEVARSPRPELADRATRGNIQPDQPTEPILPVVHGPPIAATSAEPALPATPPQAPHTAAHPAASASNMASTVQRDAREPRRAAALSPLAEDIPSETAPTHSLRPPRRPAPRLGGIGNSSQNTKKGSATGNHTAKAASAATAPSAKQSAGNAATSDYKGKVYRKVARAQRSKVSIKGKALVSLTISGNGSLSSVRIAISSGSARLDDIALAQIRRAAPFPPPPDRKPITLSVSIKGKS